jgi:hypothetical protein
VTEQEAETEATRRNLEHGKKDDGVTYWLAARQADGEWAVERRERRQGLASRIWDALTKLVRYHPDGSGCRSGRDAEAERA